jgi:hypothetical protein
MTNESKEKNEKLYADLFARMDANAKEAEALKKEAVEIGAENEQEFINWQDRLNVVSMQPEEEL